MTTSDFLPNGLIREIQKVDFKILEEHCLEGLLFKYFPELIPPEKRNPYYLKWVSRWNKVRLLENELLSWQDEIIQNGIQIVLLKGISLVHSLYPDFGSRYMSDMDVLIEKKSLTALERILTNHGYQPVKESKWEANDHKITYEKTSSDANLIIEVHFQLFYHVDHPVSDFLPWIHPPYKILNSEMNLLHLIGHIAFSHTFIKFLWMIDIYRFISLNEKIINWNYFFELVNKHQLKNSCDMVFFILDNFFKYQVLDGANALSRFKKTIYRQLITFPFLMANQNFKIQYLLVKHLTKDHPWTAIKYDVCWIIDSLNQRLKQKIGSTQK